MRLFRNTANMLRKGYERVLLPSGVNTVTVFGGEKLKVGLLQLSSVQHSMSHCNNASNVSLRRNPPKAKHAAFLSAIKENMQMYQMTEIKE